MNVSEPDGRHDPVSIFFMFYISEDAMRRSHRRPRFWGSADCESFRKLWLVNVKGCLGTVVDLYGSW